MGINKMNNGKDKIVDEYYNGPKTKMVDDIKKMVDESNLKRMFGPLDPIPGTEKKMKFVATCGFESCGLDGEPYNPDTVTVEAETAKDAEGQVKKCLQEQNKKGENPLVYDLDNIVIETLDAWFESYSLRKNFDNGGVL